MSTDIVITLTKDEAQYLLNSINTHVKTHGLAVATAGVIILSKLQAAAGDQSVNGVGPDEPEKGQKDDSAK